MFVLIISHTNYGQTVRVQFVSTIFPRHDNFRSKWNKEIGVLKLTNIILLKCSRCLELLGQFFFFSFRSQKLEICSSSTSLWLCSLECLCIAVPKPIKIAAFVSAPFYTSSPKYGVRSIINLSTFRDFELSSSKIRMQQDQRLSLA